MMYREYSFFLEDMFEEHLLKGDGSVITDDNVSELNYIAQVLYAEEYLNDTDIKSLKYLIMICNLLYNRTDMTLLPIEDGFYDLLLEKYKKYDPKFQVGSAVVDFKSFVKKDPNYQEPICPIYKIEPHKAKDDISQQMFDGITRKGEQLYDERDMHVQPIYKISSNITRRTHNTEHNHPDLVGTLDKCKFVLMSDAEAVGAELDPNVKVLERDFFQEHIKRGIISPNQRISMVLELKYDGISVEADCSNVLESARTRGDTGMGVASDITPMLDGYPFSRAKCMIGKPAVGVKFEAIMSKTNLYYYCQAREKNYTNCRMAIIGLFTSSDAYKYQDYITLVPLAVDRDQLPFINDRVMEIEFMNEVFATKGEPLRYTVITGTPMECLYLIKKYLDEASAAREYLDFMYDGIVVSYLDEGIRAKLGRENFINKYSMAVKFDPLKKLTTFRGYTYEVGQGGQITPMIHYDPVEFLGTIHNKSTGSSLARFKNLALRYGDIVEVTYTNDVMPYVTKPDIEHNRLNKNPLIEPPTTCPSCGGPLSVTDSGKTLICTNWDCIDRKVSRVANMLAKLNLKGFGETYVKYLDTYTLRELSRLDYNYLSNILGDGLARNFLQLMEDLKLSERYDYQLIGALGFSNIATKTWKLICTNLDFREFVKDYRNDSLKVVEKWYDKFMVISGVGPTTVTTIFQEMDHFIDDIEFIYTLPNLKISYGLTSGEQIRFSGCRDSQLEEHLCKLGYDADSSAGVTKNTKILIVPYDGYVSTKTRKMPPNGRVVPIREFVDNMDFYLNKNI